MVCGHLWCMMQPTLRIQNFGSILNGVYEFRGIRYQVILTDRIRDLEDFQEDLKFVISSGIGIVIKLWRDLGFGRKLRISGSGPGIWRNIPNSGIGIWLKCCVFVGHFLKAGLRQTQTQGQAWYTASVRDCSLKNEENLKNIEEIKFSVRCSM